MKLGTKLSLIGMATIALTTVTCLSIGVWQISSLTGKAERELRKATGSQLTFLAKDAQNMIRTQDHSIRSRVDTSLLVADAVIKERGRVTQAGQFTGVAVNQLTKQPTEVTLPRMSVGGKALVCNRDPQTPTPVVDEIQAITGGVVTIFQRMNQRGDMLRVATNVIGKDGKRGAGTYIPAVNPDGKPNPVVSSLLGNQTYRGMAFVVDKWYISAYKPLRDGSGRVIGAIFVGTQQENEKSLREGIQSTKIGKTGYVWVLGGTGESRGRYIISQGGKRDGEDIWNTKDSEGNLFIQKMINGALKLKPGEVFQYRYLWKNADDREARWKVASITYYEPWDWVIGASCYEDELLAGVADMRSYGRMTLWVLAVAGLLAAIVAGLVFRRYSGGISRRLASITAIADVIATGDVDAAAEMAKSSSEAA